MIACEQDTVGDEEKENDDGDTEAGEMDANQLEASLNSSSVEGIDSPKTMKFVGAVGERQVLILLDSGATHNFISEQLVAEMQILVQPTTFAVVLGDNRKVKGVGKCKGIELIVQGIRIIQDFLPFRLGGVDVILGVEWLSRLGEVKTNWGKQTIHFDWNGQKVKLKGDVSLTRLETSVETLLKLMARRVTASL